MFLALRQIRTWPLNTDFDSAAIVLSSALLEGGVNIAEFAVKVPLKLDSLPLQLEFELGISEVENQPLGGPLPSTGSAADPPRVGLPQMTKAALGGMGPLMES